jgi:hypothetical protein
MTMPTYFKFKPKQLLDDETSGIAAHPPAVI